MDDTVYLGQGVRYHIEKQTENILWFSSANGEQSRYVKSTDGTMERVFKRAHPQLQILTEVLKRDTVVYWNQDRYHIYIAINPTKYKVFRRNINLDGLVVENVYFDNIIHLSIYKGADKLFSRDFRKCFYDKMITEQVLNQAVLNDMTFEKADAEGLHLRTQLCVPDDAASYVVDHKISYQGKLDSRLMN